MSDRIYIQGDPDNRDSTWCRDRIEDGDHEYVAIAELTASNARIAELEAQFAAVIKAEIAANNAEHERIVASWKAEEESWQRQLAAVTSELRKQNEIFTGVTERTAANITELTTKYPALGEDVFVHCHDYNQKANQLLAVKIDLATMTKDRNSLRLALAGCVDACAKIHESALIAVEAGELGEKEYSRAYIQEGAATIRSLTPQDFLAEARKCREDAESWRRFEASDVGKVFIGSMELVSRSIKQDAIDAALQPAGEERMRERRKFDIDAESTIRASMQGRRTTPGTRADRRKP